MASNEIYVAKESFAIEIDGSPVIIQKDVTRVRAGHPLLKGRESLFTPLEIQYDVEQATAAPGEKRAVPEKAAKAETKTEADEA